jgi:hypothetical protein
MLELLDQDLFDQISISDAICISTNCSILDDGTNPMGGGSAGAAARRWPQLPKIYGKLLSITPNVPVILGWTAKDNTKIFVSIFSSDSEISSFMEDHETCAIVAYPTMDQITEPANIDLVLQSACLLDELADSHGWQHVVLGRQGCGIGGLNWEDVKVNLEEIFDDRFVLIHKEFLSGPFTRTWKSTAN